MPKVGFETGCKKALRRVDLLGRGISTFLTSQPLGLPKSARRHQKINAKVARLCHPEHGRAAFLRVESLLFRNLGDTFIRFRSVE